jgi:hypothetical protein
MDRESLCVAPLAGSPSSPRGASLVDGPRTLRSMTGWYIVIVLALGALFTWLDHG